VLGKKTRKHKEWLTADTWNLITERKHLKNLINHADDEEHKRDLQAQSTGKSREVQDMTRGDTSMISQRKQRQQRANKT
jgi:hypothetical protein